MAQYLDDDGTPITASGDVKLPAGYSLLSTKKNPSASKKSPKPLKEIKAEASKLAPAATPTIDYTSNPKNEGLYEMYGRTGQGDSVGSISIPYSKVQSYLANGGTFAGDTGSGARYDKDKAAEGKPVSWYQKIVQSPSLAPVANEKEQPGQIMGNKERAAARTILATPAYVKQLWDAAQSMHRGEVSGGDEFANLINPAQLPKQLYDQYKVDAKTDPKMAADNLLGSLAGLGVVGAVTHGATKALGAIPERLEDLHDKTTPVPAEAISQPAEEVHPPIQPVSGATEISDNNGAGDSQPTNVAGAGAEGNSGNTPRQEGTGVSQEISGADTPRLAQYKYEPIDTSKEVTGQFYHGTKAPISSASELDPGSHGNEQALYGIGTYLTDNPEVAKGYAKTKGKGPEGKVLPATIDNAKLLNLEQPLPQAAHQVFENMLQGITGEKESLPTTMSGKQLFGRLQEAMQDEGWPRSEAQETLSELTLELRQQGYHGLWHEGGGKVGTGPHNVAIIFPDYGVGRPLTEIVRDTVPQENTVSPHQTFGKKVIRYGGGSADASRPHGLYTSLLDNGHPSPHEDLGTPTTGVANGKKVLDIHAANIEHPRFGDMKSGGVDAGVGALKQLSSPEEFEQFRKMSKQELVDYLTEKYPGHDYSKFYDAYELLGALGANKARDLGYDSLYRPDEHIPKMDSGYRDEMKEHIKDFTEYVGLTPDAINFGGESTESDEPTGEKEPEVKSDRRQDSATRKRVEEMTPEEMKNALLTSDVTGAPNRRAFDDAEHVSPSPAIGMSDADGLKALNDKFGYAAGNELLKAKADALKAAGLDAYHEKGDEFLYRGESPESLKEKLDKAREILRDRKIEVTLKDGKKRYFKGADFSYGTGKDLDESESGLKQHKESREASGERKRGELRGITEVESEDGSEHNSSSELEDDTPSAKQEESPTTLDLNTNEKGDGGELPEQPKGEDASPPAVSSSVPVQGGTQLSSAPIQIPVVPVVKMQVLPMSQVRAMAAARNPQREPKSVREVMEESKKRSPNSIVP